MSLTEICFGGISSGRGIIVGVKEFHHGWMERFFYPPSHTDRPSHSFFYAHKKGKLKIWLAQSLSLLEIQD